MIFDNSYKYCLSYSPNQMTCPLVPFNREKFLTCNDQMTPNSPNHWVIYMGGSNANFEIKNLLDVLLEIPDGTYYDPNTQYIYNDYYYTFGPWYQGRWGTFYDFIFDSNHQVIHTAFVDISHVDPDWNDIWVREEWFLNAPVPESGATRISFIKTYLQSNFQRNVNAIMPPGCPWLATNPIVDIKLEWSGLIGDSSSSPTPHVADINFLNDRANSENIKINTFTMTDSAFDCYGYGYPIQSNIIQAIDSTPSKFPVYYWSKRAMLHQQYLLTGSCQTAGHAHPAISHVMTHGHWNTMCKSDGTFAPPLETCMNFLQSQQYYCFTEIDYW